MCVDCFAVRRLAPTISPDGSAIAFIEESQSNRWLKVLNIVNGDVVEFSVQSDHRLTRFQFADLDSHMLYLADFKGNERKSMWLVNLETGANSCIFDMAPVVRIHQNLGHFQIVETLDPTSGIRSLIRTCSNGSLETLDLGSYDTTWMLDARDNARHLRIEKQGTRAVWEVRHEFGGIGRRLGIFSCDVLSGCSPVMLNGDSLWLLDRDHFDTSSLVRMSIASGQQTVVCSDRTRDIDSVQFDHTLNVAYIRFSGGYTLPVSEQSKADWKRIIEVFDTEVSPIAVRNEITLVSLTQNDGPAYSCVGRDKGVLATIRKYPHMDSSVAVTTHRSTVLRSDGFRIESICTRPHGVEVRGCVVLIHGGPWSNDSAEFDERVARYTARGYSVLRINFRGSTGYGKKFLDAGNLQWGADILSDIEAVISDCIRRGLIDEHRLVFAGHSFGGYAALKLATRLYHPVAVIALSPVVDLVEYVKWIGESVSRFPGHRIGVLPRDKRLLEDHSPTTCGSAYSMPLLVVWGDLDARLPRNSVKNFVEQLAASGGLIDGVGLSDEGHVVTGRHNRRLVERKITALLGGA